MHFMKVILPVVVLAVGLYAFQHFKSKVTSSPSPIPVTVVKQRIPLVSVQTVKHTSVSPIIKLYGQIETPSLALLSSAVEADIKEVVVLEGNRVLKGELLLKMDDFDISLNIKKREADIAEIEALMENNKITHRYHKTALTREQALLKLSRKSVQRAKRLAQSQAGSEATLDNELKSEQQHLLAISQRQRQIEEFSSREKQFQARLIKAYTSLQQDQMKMKRTVVTAPFDGLVVDVMVSSGNRVVRGSSLIQLYNDRYLEVRAQIPNRYLDNIQSSMNASRDIHAHVSISNQWIPIKLDRISSKVGDGKGGVDAFFKLPTNLSSPIGRTVELRLYLEQIDHVVVLPVDALYGRNLVYLVKKNRLYGRQVSRLGNIWTEDDVQKLIVDGDIFQEGERILVSRLPQAIEGLSVDLKIGTE